MRSSKALVGGLAGLALALSAIVALPSPATAFSGEEFDPGFIISDERFFDYASMSEADIQRFLDEQVPVCDATDPSLPCLRHLVTSTSDREPASNGCAGYQSEGWESAAHIIYKVAQSCRINPQVILTTLQKEQSLVTSTRPSAWQYQAATGWGCPDTAECDSRYFGFFNQVYRSAWQFREYTATPYYWRYKIGVNTVQYHPNAACGSSTVVIRNQATANLYIYTPYQPNAAALANLWGSGDSCSAYGNRNFWRIFYSWFGNPAATGVGPIDALYNSRSAELGAPLSDYIPIASEYGSGTGRAYEHGSIYWTAQTGAAAVVEPFRSLYFSFDGALGPLGWPNSQSVPIPGKPGGAGQSFQRGSIYTSTETGTHTVFDEIRGAYFANSGAVGWLGWPVEEAASLHRTAPPAATATTQRFEHGTILAIPARGTFAVPTAIMEAYLSAGGPDSPLGWPTTIAFDYPYHGGGTGQIFEGASIFSSSSGTFAVAGPIRAAYFAASGGAGWLGWPAGPESCTPEACWQEFQNAWIVSDSAGARIAHPDIEALHATTGGDTGPDGRRTSELIPIPDNGGGFGQVYANASIYASDAGAYSVSGEIRGVYWSHGGSSGWLGWPTSTADCAPAGCEQRFQNGVIFAPAGGVAFATSSTIASVYEANGGMSGSLGHATSGVVAIPQNGGGTGQSFTVGSIYASPSGGFAVSGPIRDAYWARSGSAGPLGWPTSAQSCDATGVCSQQFQAGTITWSASSGAVVH